MGSQLLNILLGSETYDEVPGIVRIKLGIARVKLTQLVTLFDQTQSHTNFNDGVTFKCQIVLSLGRH
jgi:hypothetical protein